MYMSQVGRDPDVDILDLNFAVDPDSEVYFDPKPRLVTVLNVFRYD